MLPQLGGTPPDFSGKVRRLRVTQLARLPRNRKGGRSVQPLGRTERPPFLISVYQSGMQDTRAKVPAAFGEKREASPPTAFCQRCGRVKNTPTVCYSAEKLFPRRWTTSLLAITGVPCGRYTYAYGDTDSQGYVCVCACIRMGAEQHQRPGACRGFVSLS